MTKQEYNNLKEKIKSRDTLSNWFSTISELITLYPAVSVMSLTEVHEYFFHRTAEVETEIRKILNVE